MSKRKYKDNFLSLYRELKRYFKRPRLKFYLGPWRREGNLPVWRRGPQIRWGKYGEINEHWNWAKLESSEWNALGKKNHPILSKIIKTPVWQLPIWLAFHWYNDDLMYKTKWSEDDYRYEFPPHFTVVFFGLAFSITAYAPKVEGDDKYTCDDDYWETLLTFRHYGGDLKKTNDALGYYSTGKDCKIHKFKFNPHWLKNIIDQDDLVSLQAEEYNKIKEEEEHPTPTGWSIDTLMHNVEDMNLEGRWLTSYDGLKLIYETKERAEEVLANLKPVKVKKNGSMKRFKYELRAVIGYDIFKADAYPLYKSAIIDKDKNIIFGIIC